MHWIVGLQQRKSGACRRSLASNLARPQREDGLGDRRRGQHAGSRHEATIAFFFCRAALYNVAAPGSYARRVLSAGPEAKISDLQDPLSPTRRVTRSRAHLDSSSHGARG